MPATVTDQLITAHLVEGSAEAGTPIAIRIDQTLTQDATGTLVMLELEAMGLDRVHTEISAQYVDHNLLQQDHRNADDHLFLRSACRRFGLWYSPPGNGVSHPVHQDAFGRPGRTLLGSDSHTCAAGSIGMLAIGAGGLDVALAMAGEPFRLRRPRGLGVRLEGRLPEWVSAKDVILEMLRRHGVAGGVGKVIEYHGPGLASLSAMDRHVIANMGAELGATSTVFPSDSETRRYLQSVGREDEWIPLAADSDARWDEEDVIDLGKLEPLIAMPTSPGNVVPVREVAGREIYQAYVGSSANPGYRDAAIAAEIVRGKRVHERVSFDVNPVSRRVFRQLTASGTLGALLDAGARIHQTGCNGCIGMGQAPATGKISLRTVPRNFPGRSGTRDDQVCLVSPETAAASALTGRITDPRELGTKPPRIEEPVPAVAPRADLVPPLSAEDARQVTLEKGPNITSVPPLDALPADLVAPVLLKVGNDVSTDEILPAGARVLPFRSNLEAISRFAFEPIDPTYATRAQELDGPHAVVGGSNYGQGSSREHAALALRILGLRVVLARSFARIHRQNLVNFGVVPLVIASEAWESLAAGDVVRVAGIRGKLPSADTLEIELASNGSGRRRISAQVDLSPRERETLLAGGMINYVRARAVASRPS